MLPAYVSTKKKRFIIGAPRYVHEMELEGMTKEEIAEIIKNDINSQYRDYIISERTANATVTDAPVRDRNYYEKT